MKKYYITGDLEKTLIGDLSNSNCKKISIDENIRKRLIDVIDNSFNSKVTEFISYDSISNFFNELKKEQDFIIGLDDGIYLDDLDFNYSSTRTYNNKNSILNDPSNYEILQRDGSKLNSQNDELRNSIIKSGKKDIILCDDGLFSGDTLKDVLYGLEDLVKEIRVVLNFSGKKELNGIPIKSMVESGECIDWLDERDLFYGTKNGGASFKYKGKINGLSYISSVEIAKKKASIPKNEARNFCINMSELNKNVWSELEKNLDRVVNLIDLQRISYLSEEYDYNTNIVDVLNLESKKIN